MSFDPTVPKANDLLSQSQGDLVVNFNQLNEIFGNAAASDHYAFNNATASLRGLHKHVTFPVVVVDPGLANPASSAYAKTVSAASELFFQNGTLAANVKQLTGLTLATSIVAGATQYTFMSPWGIRFILGEATVSSGGTVISFTTPFTSLIYCALLTPIDPNPHKFTITSRMTTSITAKTDSGTHSFYYLAIGN